jgi:2-polyprenyl-3-methyl-5-hydroxy-6-metoxy-1,4-benzoquinol methylase
MEHVWWRTHLRQLPELGFLEKFGNFEAVDEAMPFLMEALALPPGGRVLELGCGRGSISIRLAQWGYRVTGVDESQPMIGVANAAARQRGAEVDFRAADPRQIAERSAFDAALIPDFGTLSDIDNAMMIRTVAAALRPGGKLVFGSCNPYYWSRRPRTEHRVVNRTDVIRSHHFDFQAGRVVTSVRCILQDGTRKDLPVARPRAYTLPELQALTEATGLADLRIFGEDEEGLARIDRPLDSLQTPYFHAVAVRPVTGEGGEGI